MRLSPAAFEEIVCGCQEVFKERYFSLLLRGRSVVLHTDTPSVCLVLGASELNILYTLLSEAHLLWQTYSLWADSHN
ncbi:MAG: hypothetical protein KDC37_06525 [Flavobacteriales bacterium]|nr:hypothetical protein [Flavobacteriales bacterium]